MPRERFPKQTLAFTSKTRKSANIAIAKPPPKTRPCNATVIGPPNSLSRTMARNMLKGCTWKWFSPLLRLALGLPPGQKWGPLPCKQIAVTTAPSVERTDVSDSKLLEWDTSDTLDTWIWIWPTTWLSWLSAFSLRFSLANRSFNRGRFRRSRRAPWLILSRWPGVLGVLRPVQSCNSCSSHVCSTGERKAHATEVKCVWHREVKGPKGLGMDIEGVTTL